MVPYSQREKTFKLNLFEVIYSILCAILYVYCFYTASCRYPTMKFPTICLIGKFWSRASRRCNCILHFSFFQDTMYTCIWASCSFLCANRQPYFVVDNSKSSPPTSSTLTENCSRYVAYVSTTKPTVIGFSAKFYWSEL